MSLSAGFTRSSRSNEVILQELPCIHHEDSRLEGTNEFSAGHLDSSCRIRPYLPWNPGELL